MLFACSEMKVGKAWSGRRSGSFSIATTLPMCGAMRPVAEVGFRPICIHVCASGCARAHASPDRMIAILSSTRDVLPSSLVGSVTPPNDSGAKSGGVTPGLLLKSNVST